MSRKELHKAIEHSVRWSTHLGPLEMEDIGSAGAVESPRRLGAKSGQIGYSVAPPSIVTSAPVM
jgi:hypothetical protein